MKNIILLVLLSAVPFWVVGQIPIPSVENLEARGLVRNITNFDFTDIGVIGDEKSLDTLATQRWGIYACKIALNAGDILCIKNDSSVETITIIQTADNVTSFLSSQVFFKTITTDVYYVIFAQANIVESSPYRIDISYYGTLQSLFFDNMQRVVVGMAIEDIQNALSAVTVVGTDIYNREFVFDSSIAQWIIEEDKAKFIPRLPIPPTVYYLQYPMLDNIANTLFFNYRIDIDTDGYGNVELEKMVAIPDETVTFDIIPDNGYELEILTVRQNEVEIEIENNQFVMPRGNVVITATFKPVLSNVETLHAASSLPVAYYSILGQKLPKAPESGIYIVVYDNGTVKKVIN